MYFCYYITCYILHFLVVLEVVIMIMIMIMIIKKKDRSRFILLFRVSVVAEGYETN